MDDKRFRVSTLEYAYKIDNWDDGDEIMAYHWHPDERIKYPHLHLSHGALIERHEIREAHVPTGRIAIEDVIQFLIESFGVIPFNEEWKAVLSESRDRFRAYRSWD